MKWPPICELQISKKGASAQCNADKRGLNMSNKLFAVREEILNDKEQREKLKNYLEKTGNISNLTVVTGFQGKKLVSSAPFIKQGFTYDEVNAEEFSERKLGIAVNLLLIKEGEQSSFFASEKVLLRHLEKIDK